MDQLKEKNINFKLYLFTILIIVLSLVFKFTKYNNSPNPNLEHKELGQIESIIKYGDNSIIAVHYPILGNEQIDNKIKSIIQGYVDGFIQLTKKISPIDKKYKSELNIDYEIYSHSKDIISIKFTILEDTSHYTYPSIKTHTVIYDLSKEKELYFLPDYLEIPHIKVNYNTIKKFVKSNYINKDFIETFLPINDEHPELKIISNRKIDPNMPMVALTFDDGPYIRATIPILDTLKEHNSVATFFVLGNRVPRHKEIVKRIVHEGNEIGNHSYNHKQLTTLSSKELKEQIDKTQETIIEVVGSAPKIMRPTYGSYNNRLKSQVKMPMILWSIDTEDWKYRDAEKISKHILENVKDGDIILMHDMYISTAEAVEIIVPALINRGFQLVTVSELYEIKGEALEVGNIYNRVKSR